jgi:hypothetical protein
MKYLYGPGNSTIVEKALGYNLNASLVEIQGTCPGLHLTSNKLNTINDTE